MSVNEESEVGALRRALDRIVDHSRDNTEKGRYFERAVKVYLEKDRTQRQYYDKVWHYASWAEQQGFIRTDKGIDLVARLRNSEDLVAIQCKYREENGSISKREIDSFVAEALSKGINRLIIVDTLSGDLNQNALDTLKSADPGFFRITLSEMEKGSVSWDKYCHNETITNRKVKRPRKYQRIAIDKVLSGLKKADRGSLIMACGTGKTFTSLKIAEEYAGKTSYVLFMVPSLALMSQTLREWKLDAASEFDAYAVCSDITVGRKINRNDDMITLQRHDLPFPATTDPESISALVKKSGRMTVIFSTYQSIDTISIAQKSFGLPSFDLIICDEAHRTAGADLVENSEMKQESKWLRVHSNDHVSGRKRLYMTATPKVYGETAKRKAKDRDYILASMDNEDTFGKNFHEYGFSQAVEDEVLSDYKVIIFMMDESIAEKAVHQESEDKEVQKALKDIDIRREDTAKLIGCYKALTKQNLVTKDNSKPMIRSLAFCSNIKKSKMVANEFGRVVDKFNDFEKFKKPYTLVANHVDGTDNAATREERVQWLKDANHGRQCKVLSNARCLSEGIDVPALDAVIFMHPRNSQIEVIQAVGRVMRKTSSKDMGYVILPISMPAGEEDTEKALNNNSRYKVIWQVLRALRAHDDRFQHVINKISEGEDFSEKMEIIGMRNVSDLESKVTIENFNIPRKRKEEVIDVGGKPEAEEEEIEESSQESPDHENIARQLDLFVDKWTGALLPKIVEKCGDRTYWDVLSTNLHDITKIYSSKIRQVVENEDSSAGTAFAAFVNEMHENINPSVTTDDAISMLAQHLAIRPVFEVLFREHAFTKCNPVSISMDRVLDALDWHDIESEAHDMQKFYAQIRRRVEGLTTSRGRQNLLRRIYEKLFKDAFPDMADLLGIVYTPVEIVDFIIHSVNDVLKNDFGQTLSSKGVHILDPFTGTGTFVTRLMQLGVVDRCDLERKYEKEIFANEIVPLAYYASAVNIEQVYHQIMGNSDVYTPFKGITMTDTFQLYENQGDVESYYSSENSSRRESQKNLDIKVIMGNPPYSAGKKRVMGSPNVKYPELDRRIRYTYSQGGSGGLQSELYNSYIKAFRWATDRIMNIRGNDDTGEGKGIVAFVSPGGWISKTVADQMRRRMREEYSKLYIFHLRGDGRAKMLSNANSWQGENVFGQGSMSSIAISILVRNPDLKEQGQVYFYDISSHNPNQGGLKTQEKLEIISKLRSIDGISRHYGWTAINPNDSEDWIVERDARFGTFPTLINDGTGVSVFNVYSHGIKSNRDAWVYNGDHDMLNKKMQSMIEFYNRNIGKEKSLRDLKPDPKIIKVTDKIDKLFKRNVQIEHSSSAIKEAVYRPFFKTNLYSNSHVIERPGNIEGYFPSDGSSNRVICIPGLGASAGFSALMVDTVPDYSMVQGGLCFPLNNPSKNRPPPTDRGKIIQGDGISDFALEKIKALYADTEITKEDIFYYIYGVFHSPDVIGQFATNFEMENARLPLVKTIADFHKFSAAGKTLGDIHVNYEDADLYDVTFENGDPANHPLASTAPEKLYRVQKMEKSGDDETVIVYNEHITMSQVPLRAHDYIVNGKSALWWIMNRCQIKIDTGRRSSESHIVNDPNQFAIKNRKNPRYILDLFCRTITVSLKTLDIVESLPPLKLAEISADENPFAADVKNDLFS